LASSTKTIGEEIANKWFGFLDDPPNAAKELLLKFDIATTEEELKQVVEETSPRALAKLIDDRLALAIERGE